MIPKGWQRLAGNDSGAVAATYALSLVALVAVAGVGFDYARLASLDSELQNAADQAALAGATQLDGSANAIANATKAASGSIDGSGNFVTGSALAENETLSANDISRRRVSVPTVLFYETKADAESGTSPTTDPALAHFVRVIVETRAANYALTPIVGAFFGQLNAEAVAGLGTAICKTPPVMMCNPFESTSNTDVELDFPISRGQGILLIAGDADAPGNFGFLDTGVGQGNSTPELAQSLGWNTPPGMCQPTSGVDLKTGARDVVLNALNTRFDIYESGENTCPTGGSCAPSRNPRKDVVRKNKCTLGNGGGWEESANTYYEIAQNSTTSGLPFPLPAGVTSPDLMGHPRDVCHARATEASPGTFCTAVNGGANGRVGNGVWDRNAYFRYNYGWDESTWKTQLGWMSGDPLPTRYDVYRWELDHGDATYTGTADQKQTSATANYFGYSYPICSQPGIKPGGTNIDRRRISMAAINCAALGLNGAETGVQVLKWVDVFLVEPAVSRKRSTTQVTGQRDVYIEVIGETDTGAQGSVQGQVVRRDVPYLIK